MHLRGKLSVVVIDTGIRQKWQVESGARQCSYLVGIAVQARKHTPQEEDQRSVDIRHVAQILD